MHVSGKCVNGTLWTIMPTNNYTWVLLSISFQESKSHREMLSHTHILALLCSLLSAVHSPLHCCSSGAVPSVALAPFCTMRGNTGIHLVTLRCVNWHGTNTSHPLCKWCRRRWHLGSGCELWHTCFQTAQQSTFILVFPSFLFLYLGEHHYLIQQFSSPCILHSHILLWWWSMTAATFISCSECSDFSSLSCMSSSLQLWNSISNKTS